MDGARHGGEGRAAEHEVGAVGPGAVRDDHPGARRGAELPVLAPDLQHRTHARMPESNHSLAGFLCLQDSIHPLIVMIKSHVSPLSCIQQFLNYES